MNAKIIDSNILIGHPGVVAQIVSEVKSSKGTMVLVYEFPESKCMQEQRAHASGKVARGRVRKDIWRLLTDTWKKQTFAVRVRHDGEPQGTLRARLIDARNAGAVSNAWWDKDRMWVSLAQSTLASHRRNPIICTRDTGFNDAALILAKEGIVIAVK